MQDPDPRNTALLEEDGRIMYDIKTVNSVTTIRRMPDDSGSGDKSSVIAGTIEWPARASALICVGSGPVTKQEHFLRTTKSNDRVFTAANGQNYIWVMHRSTLKLTREDSKDILAKFHLDEGRRPAGYIEIGLDAYGILDSIVVTWVWMVRQMYIQRGNNRFAAAWKEGYGGL